MTPFASRIGANYSGNAFVSLADAVIGCRAARLCASSTEE